MFFDNSQEWPSAIACTELAERAVGYGRYAYWTAKLLHVKPG
jgi:hypothetical protein